MLKKLFHSIFKLQGKSALLGLVILPFAAGLAFFANRTSIKNDKGVQTDMYLLGKKGSPKAVVITNQTPKKILKNAAKRIF